MTTPHIIPGADRFTWTDWAQMVPVAHPRAAGGPGSGNFGHAGRPGEVGGSASDSLASKETREKVIKLAGQLSQAEIDRNTLEDRLVLKLIADRPNLAGISPAVLRRDHVQSDPELIQANAKLNELANQYSDALVQQSKEEADRKIEIVTNRSAEIAQQMGFDPSLIHVVDKEPTPFTVGNMQFKEAGHFDPVTGQIEINARGAYDPVMSVTNGIAAHEISHAMFDVVKQARIREWDEVVALPVSERKRLFEEPEPNLRGNPRPEALAELRQRFPVSAMWGDARGEGFLTADSTLRQRMDNEDGHSSYARAYWTGEALRGSTQTISQGHIVSQGHPQERADNETLAEVTRWLVQPSSWHESGNPQPKSPWVTLAQDIRRAYATVKQHPRTAEFHEEDHPREPAGSPEGGQFTSGGPSAAPSVAPPSGEVATTPSVEATPSGETDSKLVTLKTGDVVDSEELGGGSNVTMLVDLKNGGEVKAVYKPEVGELWDGSFANYEISDAITNKEFSLAEREAAAYDADQILGTNLVPETVLRETLDVDTPNVESGYDSAVAREEYDQYASRARERGYDVVAEAMGEKFVEAQNEYVSDVENRVTEMQDIWNNLVDQLPEDTKNYGTEIDQHPVLPGVDFNVREQGAKVVDPYAILKEADVDVSSKMSGEERGNVEALLRRELEHGYGEFGDIDPDVVREGVDRTEWYQAHEDTEAQLLDSQVQSFSAWKQDHGYESSSGGGVSVRNFDAPHPNGGSLQRFVADSTYGHLSDDDNTRMAVLDYAIGSMDRHGHNVLFTNDESSGSSGSTKGHAIDNGYSFPNGPALIRSLANPPSSISESLRQQLFDRLHAANWSLFFEKHSSMDTKERSALLVRVAKLEQALATPTGLKALWTATRRM